MGRHLQPCVSCGPDTPPTLADLDRGRDLTPALLTRPGERFLLLPRRGFTRHADRRCARCRRYGPPARVNYRGRGA